MRCLDCQAAFNIAHAKRADDRDSSIIERWSVTCPGCSKVLKVTVSDPDTSSARPEAGSHRVGARFSARGFGGTVLS